MEKSLKLLFQSKELKKANKEVKSEDDFLYNFILKMKVFFKDMSNIETDFYLKEDEIYKESVRRGIKYFLLKLNYIKKRYYKYNLSLDDSIKIKNLFSLKMNQKRYFRLSFGEYKKLNSKDKILINKAFVLKTKRYNYYVLNNYIYDDLTLKLENNYLIYKISIFYISRLRKKSIYKNSDFNKKMLKINYDRKNIIKEKNKYKKSVDFLNKKICISSSIKEIESYLNKLLEIKINIAEDLSSVVIFDEENNYFFKYRIEIKKDDCDYSGVCDYIGEKIEIIDIEDKLNFIQTLFHEIGHIYDYFLNYFNIREKKIKCKRDNFEDINVEVVSILFEKISSNIIKNKYNLSNKYDYNCSMDMEFFLFNLAIGNLDLIKTKPLNINSFMDELYLYELIAAGFLNFDSNEIEKGMTFYTYGHIESEKILNNLNLSY